MADTDHRDGAGPSSSASMLDLSVKNASKPSAPDFKVQLPEDATLGDLKARLQQEYEGQPHPAFQIVIHAGKVLKGDEVKLSTVLKQNIDPSLPHSLHLVVKGPPQSQQQQQQQQQSPVTASVASSSASEQGGSSSRPQQQSHPPQVFPPQFTSSGPAPQQQYAPEVGGFAMPPSGFYDATLPDFQRMPRPQFQSMPPSGLMMPCQPPMPSAYMMPLMPPAAIVTPSMMGMNTPEMMAAYNAALAALTGGTGAVAGTPVLATVPQPGTGVQTGGGAAAPASSTGASQSSAAESGFSAQGSGAVPEPQGPQQQQQQQAAAGIVPPQPPSTTAPGEASGSGTLPEGVPTPATNNPTPAMAPAPVQPVPYPPGHPFAEAIGPQDQPFHLNQAQQQQIRMGPGQPHPFMQQQPFPPMPAGPMWPAYPYGMPAPWGYPYPYGYPPFAQLPPPGYQMPFFPPQQQQQQQDGADPQEMAPPPWAAPQARQVMRQWGAGGVRFGQVGPIQVPGRPAIRVRFIRINLRTLLQGMVVLLILYQHCPPGRFLMLVLGGLLLYLTALTPLRRMLTQAIASVMAPRPAAGNPGAAARADGAAGAPAGAPLGGAVGGGAAGAAAAAPARNSLARELQAIVLGFFTSLLPGWNMNAEDAAAFAAAQQVAAREEAREAERAGGVPGPDPDMQHPHRD